LFTQKKHQGKGISWGRVNQPSKKIRKVSWKKAVVWTAVPGGDREEKRKNNGVPPGWVPGNFPGKKDGVFGGRDQKEPAAPRNKGREMPERKIWNFWGGQKKPQGS